MREKFGDMWQMPADAVCITTNGFIKANGHGVMGAGTAGQAQKRWPYFPEVLGACLKDGGNHVQIMEWEEHCGKTIPFLMFPVKHVWYDDALVTLIKRSAEELLDIADAHDGWMDILIPHPNYNNDNLTWKEVEPIINFLDDRFIIVDR